ncbi:MAG TPA: hydantoinase B/oxoprolinase family protein [Candidatus Dormibacteraeota bacterium]|nr:hydantoinase B/oxoprolinase family protein [Candidatus Dormibacteraeota bacterium]
MNSNEAAAQSLNPILFEVIRNALSEATEEMSVCLQRTAYSTNIKTRLDFSSAYVDARGRMVAQAFCQPAHLVTIGRIVPRAVAEYGAKNLRPGDVLLVNDPHRQASHLNDIFSISPFHYTDELLGYVANICHHVDVGGGAPSSIGAFREIYQEGLILPVVKLVSEGEIVADVLKMVLANVRAKKEVAGDLRAQISANQIGIRRLTQLLDRYGAPTVNFYIEKLIEYSEHRVLAELARLPRGTFEGEDQLDDDGITSEPVHLKARVTLDGKSVTFDFTGTDSQRPAPMNCNLTQTFTACVYVLKCLIDRDIPLNEGFYRPIHIVAPEGSAVNATHPTAIVGGWEVSMRLCEVLFKALSSALPEQVPAGSKGMVCHVGFGGKDPNTGDYYCFLETLGGGYGGRVSSDGPDAVQTHIQNTQNAPVEETELNYPVRIPRYSLVPDSDGAGRWRGGLGLCREYVYVGHQPVVTILADRAKFPALGLFGGGAGKLARYLLITDTSTREIPSKGSMQVKPGEIMRVETCGGGGYGYAWERDAELVLRDVREGKVSAKRARDAYGVSIDTVKWTINQVESERLRRQLQRKKR